MRVAADLSGGGCGGLNESSGWETAVGRLGLVAEQVTTGWT